MHVEILGFKVNKINAYIKDYFTGKVKIGEILKNRLLSLPAVRGMCRVPVVLKIVCKVQEYMGEDGLPRTMSGISRNTFVVNFTTPNSRLILNQLCLSLI